MSDRKLLEQAAKACGYETDHPWNAERLTLDPPVIALCINGVSTGWNPLDDDGHAFRLAVDNALFTTNHPCFYKHLLKLLESGMRRQEAHRRAVVMAVVELVSRQKTI